jgi:hypothetical protein
MRSLKAPVEISGRPVDLKLDRRVHLVWATGRGHAHGEWIGWDALPL